MADVTRDQFDEDLLVQKKFFQQNKLLLDDEANVIQDIWRYKLGRMFSELVESQDVRLGDGFKVVDHGDANTVTVKAGAIAVLLDDSKSSVRRELIWMGSDVNLDSFTTPSGSNRLDYVYLDITEDEVDPSGDPNLINPAYGSETTRDLRLSWSIEISQGSGEGSPPAGHWYRRLAVIQRTNGVAQIQPEDITLSVPDHFAYLRQDGSKELNGNLPVKDGVLIDGTDVSETLLRDGSRSVTSDLPVDPGVTIDGRDVSADGATFDTFLANYRELIFASGQTKEHNTSGAVDSNPYWFLEDSSTIYVRKIGRSAYKRELLDVVRMRFYHNLNGGWIKLDIPGVSFSEVEALVGDAGYRELSVNVSTLAVNDHIQIDVYMKSAPSSFYIRDVNIWLAHS